MSWKGTISFAHVFVINDGIIVYLCTTVYINGNEVELRLGTNVAIYSGSIVLMYS